MPFLVLLGRSHPLTHPAIVGYQSKQAKTGLEGVLHSQREKFAEGEIQLCRTTYKPPVKRAIRREALSLPCPTCGVKPGERCMNKTGLPRTDPHRDRRHIASGLNGGIG